MYINYKGKKTWLNLDAYDYDIDYGVLQAEVQKVADADATNEGSGLYIGIYNPINGLFKWEKTPQGFAFWMNINNTQTSSNRVFFKLDRVGIGEKLAKYFGVVTGEYGLYIKNVSTKYTSYVWGDGVLKGYKADGTTSCLKLHTFLKNRGLPEELIQECMGILKQEVQYEWGYSTLSDGYQNTKICSCMRGLGSYYYKFDDYGKILQASLDGEEVGRAIVWTDVKGLPDGCLGFMDRIYPSDNHVIVEAFKEYARKHKLLYKKQQSYTCDTSFVWCGSDWESSSLELHVGDLIDCDTPYMDTFRYYNDGVLYNDSCSADYTLDKTDGRAMYINRYTCDCCGTDISSEDDQYYSEYLSEVLCEECYYDSHYTCECCGETYHRDRMQSTCDDYVCESCALDSYVYCEHESYYIPIDDSVFCEDTQDYIPASYDYLYSGYSNEYSYTREIVYVTNERGSTQQWFEDEAEENAYQHSDGKYYTYEEENDEND